MVTARKVTRTVIDPDSNIEKIVDLGFVGEPEQVNRSVLDAVLKAELIPVLAPVAIGADGQTYNVNADTFAGAIAGAMTAKRLLLLTDVPGVLDKNKNLIPEMTIEDCRRLIADGTITDGMIPKIETCIYALERGVEAVVILDGKVPHAVLLELFTDHGAGTLIRRGAERWRRGGTSVPPFAGGTPFGSGSYPNGPVHPHSSSMGPAGPIVVFAALSVDRRPSIQPHLSAPALAGLRACGHLDLRPRQHPLSARLRVWPQIDDRITLYIAELFGLDGLSARGAAEILLSQIRHDPAGADRRVRDRSLRVPRLRPRHRPFRHRAERFLGASHRTVARPQAHPHERLAQACGKRRAQDRHPRPFRGRVRHRGLRFVPKPERRPTSAFLDKHGVEPRAPPCSRTSPRT